MKDCIGGVILYDETIRQISSKKSTIPELILTKYLRNSFLATKVAFFNEVFDLVDPPTVNNLFFTLLILFICFRINLHKSSMCKTSLTW